MFTISRWLGLYFHDTETRTLKKSHCSTKIGGVKSTAMKTEIFLTFLLAGKSRTPSSARKHLRSLVLGLFCIMCHFNVTQSLYFLIPESSMRRADQLPNFNLI